MIGLITSVAGNAHLLLAGEHRQIDQPSCSARMSHLIKRTDLTQMTLFLHHTGESNTFSFRKKRRDADLKRQDGKPRDP